MGEGMCGPAVLAEPLTQLEDRVNQLLTGSRVAGIPYHITVQPGFVVYESKYNNASLLGSIKSLLDKFQNPGRLTTNIAGVSGPLLLFGAANTRQMQQASTVDEIAAAVFRRPTVSSDVIMGIRDGLINPDKAIVMTIFDPRGGIPDDIYDETARILRDVGCSPVYNQDRKYDFTYSGQN